MDYEHRLEDAVDLLWGWMPAEQVKEIGSEMPTLAEFCRSVHQKVSHEAAMASATTKTTRVVPVPPAPTGDYVRPEGCNCPMFSDTGGFRLADLTCSVHGALGSDPGDGYWERAPSSDNAD